MPGYIYRGNQPEAPRKAHAPRSGRPGGGIAPFDPSKCGERKGYAQHLRHKHEPCQPCRDANAAYCRDYAKKGGG